MTKMSPDHPLYSYVPFKLTDWNDWLERWQSVSTIEQREGLLHVGLRRTSDFDKSWSRRVDFYLRVADGYLLSHNFEKPRESAGRGSPSEDRQRLARKAFEQLCEKVFTFEARDERCLGLLQVDTRLAWFFRPSRFGSLHNLGYLDGDRHERILAQFAKAFCRFVFEDRFEGQTLEGHRLLKNELEQIKALRIALMPLLAGLSELPLLLRRSYVCDDACQEWLRQAAFEAINNPENGYKRIVPTSLDEAILAGSQAAEVLLLWQIKSRERARLDELKRIEREQAELEEQAAALRGEVSREA